MEGAFGAACEFVFFLTRGRRHFQGHGRVGVVAVFFRGEIEFD